MQRQQRQLADMKIQQQQQRQKQKHLQIGCCEQLQENSSSCTSSSLIFSFNKRLRPLAPKFTSKSPETKSSSSLIHLQALKNSPIPVRTSLTKHIKGASHPTDVAESSLSAQSSGGATRWNPSAEQIRALEALYGGGMRTPNAHQIEHITQELSKHGRIEGKNVFYWFQNHKARDRQKQKRTALLLALSSNTTTGEDQRDEKYYGGFSKRRCRGCSGTSDGLDAENKGDDDDDDGGGGGGDDNDETLELFPLHPEGKKQMRSIELIKEGFN